MATNDPLVIQVAEQFRDELRAAEDVQTAIMAQRWLDVERALEQEIDDLAEQLTRKFSPYDDPPPEHLIFQQERYQVLLAQVTSEIRKYIHSLDDLLSPALNAQAQRGVSDAADLTRLVAQHYGQSILVSLMGLNTEAVENIVAIARAGQPLEELMSRAYGEAANGMVRELINGIARGMSPRVTARNMRESGLSQAYYHTELVASDMHNRVYREASRQQYQRSGVVDGFVRLAAKSDRTCLACLALDGKYYPTDELMELHPKDRCTMVPRVKGLPPVRFQTGKEWFESLDYDVQRHMMGPTRHDAWLDGRFEFEDMATSNPNDIWGPSAQVTPVQVLLGR